MFSLEVKLVSNECRSRAEESLNDFFHRMFNMKYTLFLISNILCLECSLILYKNIEKSKMHDETVILGEIISNYLFQYFNEEKVFVAIVTVSLNDHQKYLQSDLIRNLMSSPKIINFSFNVQNKVDQSRQGNKQVFNLIIADGITSLM